MRCKYPNCRMPAVSRGLCSTHLRRLVRAERITEAQRGGCEGQENLEHHLNQARATMADTGRLRRLHDKADQALTDLDAELQGQEALQEELRALQEERAAQGVELQRLREALARALAEAQGLREEGDGLRAALAGGRTGIEALCRATAGLVAPAIEELLASAADTLKNVVFDARGAIPVIEVGVRAYRAKGKDLPASGSRTRAMRCIETLRKASLEGAVVVLRVGRNAQLWVFAYKIDRRPGATQRATFAQKCDKR